MWATRPGTKDARVSIKLFYGDDGLYEVPERSLKPGEQIWPNVGDLIRNQVPDKKGRVIPPDTMAGSYQIEDLNDSNIGYLYEGKLVTDKTFGHATYGCAPCCGYDDAFLLPDPLGVPVGGGGGFAVWATNSCTGQDQQKAGAYSWTSTHTSIATIDQSGYMTGVSPGSTSMFSDISLKSPGVNRCTTLIFVPTGTGTVKACPATASTVLTDPLNLASVYPGLLSGIGNVARVTVGPSGTTWDGQSLTETVSLVSGTNTCPTGLPNACVGSATFQVGASYQPAVKEGNNVVNVDPLLVGTTNEFFDEYAETSNYSLLDYYGGGTQCVQTCSQQYKMRVGNR